MGIHLCQGCECAAPCSGGHNRWQNCTVAWAQQGCSLFLDKHWKADGMQCVVHMTERMIGGLCVAPLPAAGLWHLFLTTRDPP